MERTVITCVAVERRQSTTTGENTMTKQSAAGEMTLEAMTQEEFDQATSECDGKKLVEYLWSVQDGDECINYTAMAFAEHGEIAEIVNIPRSGDLQAVAERMSSALRRSMESMQKHGDTKLFIVVDMDSNHDDWTIADHEKWITDIHIV
jgi:hypothetical protein